MFGLRLGLPVLLLTVATACGGASQAPSSPTASSLTASAMSGSAPAPAAEGGSSAPPADRGPCVVGFDELRVGGAPFSTLTTCGLTVTATAASWVASITYGHPAPFVQFTTPGGTTAVGEIDLSAAGATFWFGAVDIYSSTTKIPYEISGLANGAVAFTISGVQGNTFGNFATITNTSAAIAIDTLRIRLTNPAAPCCANPVGLDNIRVIR